MNQPNIPLYPNGTLLTVGTHRALIKKYLTSGGFAQIYAVEITPVDTYSKSNVACLKRVIVPTKSGLNTLRAEVDAMKLLKNNRHVVSYIDSNAVKSAFNNGSYEVLLLMEYCEGGGLIDFMNSRLQNRLSEAEILNILSQTAQGVANMHALQPVLLHRDIKIENVLRSGNGEFKLCDFGSVCGYIRPPRNQQELSYVQHDILKNTTAQYRCPEMLDLYRGLPIDEKSDIWALGVFLYKLCYYTTPFEKTGENAILHSKFQYPAFPIYSDRLKNLIRVMLSENPTKRPNICELLEEISSIQGVPCPIQNFYLIRAQQLANQIQLQRQTTVPKIATAQPIQQLNARTQTMPIINTKANTSLVTPITVPVLSENTRLPALELDIKVPQFSPSLDKDMYMKLHPFQKSGTLLTPSKTASVSPIRRYISRSPSRDNTNYDIQRRRTSQYDHDQNQSNYMGRSLSRTSSIKSTSALSFEGNLQGNNTGDSFAQKFTNKIKRVVTGESRNASPIRSRQDTGGSVRSAFGAIRGAFTGSMRAPSLDNNTNNSMHNNSNNNTSRNSSYGRHNIITNPIKEEDSRNMTKAKLAKRHTMPPGMLYDLENLEIENEGYHASEYYRSHSPTKPFVTKTTRDNIQQRVQNLLSESEQPMERNNIDTHHTNAVSHSMIPRNLNSREKDSLRYSSVVINPLEDIGSSPKKAPPLPFKPHHLRPKPPPKPTYLSKMFSKERISSTATEQLVTLDVDTLERDFRKRFPSTLENR
ncbi:serine/threonine protein kinase PRK1 NDAI_0B03560 [Naumovozyma dairenensis CBS 421]|uniref:non-specific serine/threonine protein kinase n=1 Tax=Naumovozyma dairenensis (strain ATCC 10597 / BCRC 20456 / CBS 421 / NBRC 0211 / NRRL Y-12639) TaxID=1071378 RepID=G0W6H9_NAUDC|nr:hypothetical protein NDAI_0B03560 [Naumovozyma dairenensis CBS 421]CCD23390.1 hypothetical protein NDAI_0B03560 [Naumovozyma dairenensis CBS 421]